MAVYGYSTDENGLPKIQDCKRQIFNTYNTAPEVTSLYKKFYDNENGLLDKFINFWSVVAQKFKNSEYVIGYDIWNEPFPGGLYDDPLKMISPGKADDAQLLPFYRKIDSSLRKIDPEFLLMFEPMPFPDYIQLFSDISIRGRFSEAPLQSENLKQKQMLNYHSYCCSAGFKMCSKGEPQLKDAEFCRKLHKENVNLANEYSKSFGFGSIITEFGACFNTEACFAEITSLTDAADEALNSWAYWMYKPFNDFTTSCIDDKEGLFEKDGTLQDKKVRALTRSYVEAFQGEPVFMKFFVEEKVFVFKFVLDRKINSPTRVYFYKELNYKDGIRLFSSHEKFNVYNDEVNYLGLKFEKEEIEINKNKDQKDLSLPEEKELVTFMLTPKIYRIDSKKNQLIRKYYEEAKLKMIFENQ